MSREHGIHTLTLVATGSGLPPEEELLRQEEADERPRASTYRRALNTDSLDERFLAASLAHRSPFYSRIPPSMAQTLEAFRLRNRYDAIISWSEQLGIPLAGLFTFARSRPVHVALFSWISKPKKAMLLRRVHRHIDRFVLWSSVQRDFAIERLGIPPRKVVLTRYYADQQFWRPMHEPASDTICAAGREMRDYGTLVESLRDLPIPCHIAAKAYPGKQDNWIDTLRHTGALPPHITVGPKSPVELRRLYNRARFVVIPILPTDTDNGVTCILEAMATGKAVICSRVRGQRDVIQEGKTGIYVAPEDPRALRAAIEYLWNNPSAAEKMGAEARARVERYHTLDAWVAGIRDVVEDAISERGRTVKRRPLSVAMNGA